MVSSRKAELRQRRKLLKTAKGYFVPRCLRKATKNRCMAGVSREMIVCSCKGGPKIALETSRNWRWQRHPCLGKQITENETNGKKRVELEPWKTKSVADLKAALGMEMQSLELVKMVFSCFVVVAVAFIFVAVVVQYFPHYILIPLIWYCNAYSVPLYVGSIWSISSFWF